MPDPIHQAAAHFWEVALTMSRAKIGDDLAMESNELVEARARLEAERTALAVEADKQLARQEGLDAAMRATTAQLSVANDSIAALEQQSAQWAINKAELQEQAITFAKERDSLRTQLDSERATHEAARIQLEERTAAHEIRWIQEVDRSREFAKQIQARLAKHEKAHAENVAAWNVLQDRLEADLATMTIRSMRQQMDVDQTTEALSALKKNHQASISATALREAALLSQTERLQVQLSDVLEQLRAKDTEISTLRSSLLRNELIDEKRLPVRTKAVSKAPKAK